MNQWNIKKHEWFKTLTNTKTHFTINIECEKKKKTFSIIIRPIGQFFFKSIIPLTQIFGGPSPIFVD